MGRRGIAASVVVSVRGKKSDGGCDAGAGAAGVGVAEREGASNDGWGGQGGATKGGDGEIRAVMVDGVCISRPLKAPPTVPKNVPPSLAARSIPAVTTQRAPPWGPARSTLDVLENERCRVRCRSLRAAHRVQRWCLRPPSPAAPAPPNQASSTSPRESVA